MCYIVIIKFNTIETSKICYIFIKQIQKFPTTHEYNIIIYLIQ